jgi:cell shape-determining protein MreC
MSDQDFQKQRLESLEVEVKVLSEEYKKLLRKLEAFTPGGSEFYNDPDRCLRYLSDRLATLGKIAAERNSYRRIAEEYEARLIEEKLL